MKYLNNNIVWTLDLEVYTEQIFFKISTSIVAVNVIVVVFVFFSLDDMTEYYYERKIDLGK